MQRGSVMDMPIHPGDPLTPGLGVGAGRARRLDRADVEDAPEDSGAADLVRRCAAAAAQPEGAGRAREPGAARCRSRITSGRARRRSTSSWRSTGRSRPLYNVIARIDGSRVSRRVDHPRQPSRRVGQRRVRSDQRQRRADGDGARPRRAAEDRLAAEAHHRPRVVGRRGVGTARIDRVGREARRTELATKAVAYINSDSTGKGWLSMCGSHSLQAFVNDVARDVPDPRGTGKSVLEAKRERDARARRRPTRHAPRSAARRPADRRARIGLRLHGVPRPPRDRVARPGLRRRRRRRRLSLGLRLVLLVHALLGRRLHAHARRCRASIGTALLRLADADVLPFEFTGTASTLRRLRRRDRRSSRKRHARPASTSSRFASRSSGCDRRAADVRQGDAPASRAAAPAGRRDARRAQSHCSTPPSARSATRPDCRRREWFKHLAYAPGFYTGYGVKTLPGIREASNRSSGTKRAQFVPIVAAAVDRLRGRRREGDRRCATRCDKSNGSVQASQRSAGTA